MSGDIHEHPAAVISRNSVQQIGDNSDLDDGHCLPSMVRIRGRVLLYIGLCGVVAGVGCGVPNKVMLLHLCLVGTCDASMMVLAHLLQGPHAL